MILEKIRELVEKITQECGVDLYDLEMKNTNKGKVLRVFITRQGGITLSDCSRVSRLMGNELDIVDLIANHYFLEVSSPGLERSLKTPKQFEQAVNEQVKITYRQDDKNIVVTGLLTKVSSTGIVLEQKQTKKEETQIVNIPFEKIKKARTVYEFKNKKGE
ncbi:MAG: ribosome maturation factor RimP [Candidatus Cloacimonetes bacterium]|nr:ribosome maturation factor RimP [Candidatus Cloacimonadota bacterium]